MENDPVTFFPNNLFVAFLWFPSIAGSTKNHLFSRSLGLHPPSMVQKIPGTAPSKQFSTVFKALSSQLAFKVAFIWDLLKSMLFVKSFWIQFICFLIIFLGKRKKLYKTPTNHKIVNHIIPWFQGATNRVHKLIFQDSQEQSVHYQYT